MISVYELADLWYLRYGATEWVERDELDETWQLFADALKKSNLLDYEWLPYSSKRTASTRNFEVYKLKTQ